MHRCARRRGAALVALLLALLAAAPATALAAGPLGGPVDPAVEPCLSALDARAGCDGVAGDWWDAALAPDGRTVAFATAGPQAP